MIQHSSPISGIAAFKDQLVMTAGYDNQVILWDAQSSIAIERGSHDHLANQCEFSRCGKFAASSSSDYSVRIWQVPSMRLIGLITQHLDDVEGIAFHPSKELVATCSRDRTVCVFTFNGDLVAKFTGHEADVISVAWHSDNDTIISSSDDGTIRKWSLDSNEMLDIIDLGGIETDTIAISPDGVIYAGNDHGEIITVRGGGKHFEQGHNAGIKRLVYDPEQTLLVSLSYDRQMKIWDCSNTKINCIHTANLPNIVWPRSCAFLGKDKLAFVTFGSHYAEYQISSQCWQLDHINDTHGINAIADYNGKIYTVGDAGIVKCDDEIICQLPSLCNFLTPYNNFMVTGGQTGQVFDALTGNCIYQHKSPLNCGCVFTHNGEQKVIIGSYTGEGLIFHTRDGQLQYENEISLHNNAIKGISASSDTIFSVCADAAAAFHNTSDYIERRYIKDAHEMIINDCDADASGTMVSVSRDLKLKIWKDNSVLEVTTPNKNSIKCVAISDDGQFIATGNYTGYIGIYHPASQNWIYWQHATASGISSITLDNEQNFIASSYDGVSHLIERSSFVIRECA